MLSDKTYREWTKVFNLTSHFEGDWSEGSKMLFLGTDENGENEGGMVSRIVKSAPHEYMSIEHIGLIGDGKMSIATRITPLMKKTVSQSFWLR